VGALARQGEIERCSSLRVCVGPQPTAVRFDDRRLIVKPFPEPSGLVVKNAPKIWSTCSAGNPIPVSLTAPESGVFLEHGLQVPLVSWIYEERKAQGSYPDGRTLHLVVLLSRCTQMPE
jgi:hypothetical protein